MIINQLARSQAILSAFAYLAADMNRLSGLINWALPQSVLALYSEFVVQIFAKWGRFAFCKHQQLLFAFVLVVDKRCSILFGCVVCGNHKGVLPQRRCARPLPGNQKGDRYAERALSYPLPDWVSFDA